jgi:hypothetical protein
MLFHGSWHRSWHRSWPFLLPLPLLLWPALLNGYPIVFSDTGTYLSQAIHLYVGWDRPAFYSLFMVALHWTLSTWPVVLAQAFAAVWMLDRVRQVFFPVLPRAALPLFFLVLALATGLPWLISRLMPDLFTPLLVLALAILLLVPERLSARQNLVLSLAAVAMTAVHQSNVPLAIGLLVVLMPLRGWLGAAVPLGTVGLLRLAAIPVLALAALAAVNLAAHGKFSPSPFGNVFLLARVIYDGPGMRALERECPRADWRLCGQLGRFPDNSDDFLWLEDSPLNRVGGAKMITAEATAIIIAALRAEPWAEASAVLDNAVQQLRLFSPGDGLHAWPATVTPWIARDFPAFERRGYEDARQNRGALAVPGWIETADRFSAVFGIAGLFGVFLWELFRRSPRARSPRVGLCAAVLLAVLGNAVITGGLSGPHDRYQSRVIWLPAAILLLLLADRLAQPGARIAVLHRAGAAGRDGVLLRPPTKPHAFA